MREGRRFRYLILVALFALIAAACGGDNPADPGDDGTPTTGAAPSDIRVGVAFDIGGLGDQSFNDAAERGLQAAIDEGTHRRGQRRAPRAERQRLQP